MADALLNLIAPLLAVFGTLALVGAGLYWVLAKALRSAEQQLDVISLTSRGAEMLEERAKSASGGSPGEPVAVGAARVALAAPLQVPNDATDPPIRVRGGFARPWPTPARVAEAYGAGPGHPRASCGPCARLKALFQTTFGKR